MKVLIAFGICFHFQLPNDVDLFFWGEWFHLVMTYVSVTLLLNYQERTPPPLATHLYVNILRNLLWNSELICIFLGARYVTAWNEWRVMALIFFCFNLWVGCCIAIDSRHTVGWICFNKFCNSMCLWMNMSHKHTCHVDVNLWEGEEEHWKESDCLHWMIIYRYFVRGNLIVGCCLYLDGLIVSSFEHPWNDRVSFSGCYYF